MNIAKINKHERDSRITFDEEPHIYYVDGEAYEDSVTGFVHSFFDCFDGKEVIQKYYDYWQSNENHKYFGMSPQEILESWENNPAADLGTQLHKKIEDFYNGELKEDSTPEFKHFLKFYKDHEQLKPYRTEWMVFDEELRLAGSIDMLYIDENEELMIYDWKRSKEIKEQANDEGKYPLSHLPNANYWHYSLQLNVYKAILEKKYDKKVSIMRLVILHPNNDSYEVIKVPDLSEEVELMFKERLEQINKKEILAKH